MGQFDVWLMSSWAPVLLYQFFESTRRSFLPLGRFSISYLSQDRFFDLTVTLEASRALTLCGMMLPHVQIRSAQVAFIDFDIQRRYNTGQLTFSADAQWSSWHDPEIACFWVFSGGELIFSAVVCWPCSSRGRNNMFRDFGSLRLLKFHASCCKAQKCL